MIEQSIDNRGEVSEANVLWLPQASSEEAFQEEWGTILCKSLNIPWAESVQLSERKRMHPFREEKPYFGFMSASREMWKKRTRVKSARRIIQMPPIELNDLQ